MPKSPRKNRTLKIAVAGSSGRMGREILALIEEDPGLRLSGELNRPDKSSPNLDSSDVMIEFALTDGFRRALKWCVQHDKPLVSGTTGLGDSERRLLTQAARKIPILYSANMSLGIAAVKAMLPALNLVQDWDFHVDEIHHAQKKDRPSGTAKLLNEALEGAIQRKTPTPNSIRGGGVPGLHQVWALGPEEMILLQHTAFNRRVFARGALRAARWLFDKEQPGLYDLGDIFKHQTINKLS